MMWYIVTKNDSDLQANRLYVSVCVVIQENMDLLPRELYVYLACFTCLTEINAS